MVRLKSIYADAHIDDGTRILVMRRWPRGVRKDRVDEWRKDLSPSAELLDAYRTKKMTAPEFFERFRREMAGRDDLLEPLALRAKTETLTLLCWERRDNECHRHVLKALIEAPGRAGRSRRNGP